MLTSEPQKSHEGQWRQPEARRLGASVGGGRSARSSSASLRCLPSGMRRLLRRSPPASVGACLPRKLSISFSVCVPSPLGPEAQQTFLTILPKFPLSAYATQAALKCYQLVLKARPWPGKPRSAGEALCLGICNLVIET